MTIQHKMIWNEAKDYMFIALGLAIYTVAFTVFLMPYQIVAGGVICHLHPLLHADVCPGNHA